MTTVNATFSPETAREQQHRVNQAEQYINQSGRPEIIVDGKKLKDSGKREEFPTGAVRDARQGKGRFDLLPFEGLERVAQTFEDGCQKYGENNWLLGIPVSRFIDSALRHTFKYLAGHMDEDHLSQATWNLLCALTTEARAERGTLPKELLLESRQKYIGHPEAG